MIGKSGKNPNGFFCTSSLASAKTRRKLDVEWVMTKLLNLNKLKIEYFGSDRWKDMGNIVDMLVTRDLVDAEDRNHGAGLKLAD